MVINNNYKVYIYSIIKNYIQPVTILEYFFLSDLLPTYINLKYAREIVLIFNNNISSINNKYSYLFPFYINLKCQRNLKKNFNNNFSSSNNRYSDMFSFYINLNISVKLFQFLMTISPF